MLYLLPHTSLSWDVFCNLTKDIQRLSLNILKFLVSDIAAQNQGVLSSSCPITRWILLGVAIVRLGNQQSLLAQNDLWPESQLFSSKSLDSITET